MDLLKRANFEEEIVSQNVKKKTFHSTSLRYQSCQWILYQTMTLERITDPTNPTRKLSATTETKQKSKQEETSENVLRNGSCDRFR